MVNAATIKALQYIMRKDEGLDGDAQRLGQLVWMIFLKVLDDREREWETLDPSYTSPIPTAFRWRSWAANPEGPTGAELLEFVDRELFPGLKVLPSVSGLSDVIKTVFEDAHNYMKSGTLLRQVANRIESDLDFNRSLDRHVFGDLYEQLLNGLQSAGDAGEYYTPRPVTQLMTDLVGPRLGETVLDPACGTGGFLTSALEYVRDHEVTTAEDERVVQDSIKGIEKKSLPHLLCVTNMILHGTDVPTGILRDNTLARPLRDWGPAERVDVVLTNPPFRGMERDGIESNYPSPFKTRETADLFLLLAIHLLKPGGRASIVLPDSSLFGDDIKYELRRKLLDECDVHTIVRLPAGVFAPYAETVKTNLVFFTKGSPTEEIWFYEHLCPFGERYTKTKPLTHQDLAPVRSWWLARGTNERAWCVSRKEMEERGLNLDIPNPSQPDYRVMLETAVQVQSDAAARVAKIESLIAKSIEDSPVPLGPRVEEMLRMVATVGPYTAMGSGVVENLRTALTELALGGGLSVALPEDEDVMVSIARFTGAPERPRKTGLSKPPPFLLPDHWEWRRLAEISGFSIGKTPSTKDARYWTSAPESDEGFAWTSISDMPRRGVVGATARRITELAAEECFKKPPVRAGALLMAFKLSVGKTAVLGIDSYHNEAIASMNIDDDVLKSYLLWALPAMAAYAAANPAMMGATLNSKTIAALWIPIPPRPEQQRIVLGLRWLGDLVDEIAGHMGTVQEMSGQVLKLIALRRAMSGWRDEAVP